MMEAKVICIHPMLYRFYGVAIYWAGPRKGQRWETSNCERQSMKPSESAIRSAKRRLLQHLKLLLTKDDDLIPHELDHDSPKHAAFYAARDRLADEFSVRGEDWMEQAVEAVLPRKRR